MGSFADIRGWSSAEREDRLRAIRKVLDVNTLPEVCFMATDGILRLLDETIVIFLESLKEVISEKRWKESSLDLFLGVIEGNVGRSWDLLRERFKETAEMIQRFQTGSQEEKKRIRANLFSRGMI